MFSRFVVPGSVLGLFSGMFLGIINYMIFVPIPSFDTLYFVAYGAILGFLLGAINGVVLGLLTAVFGENVTYKLAYRLAMGFVSIVISDVLTAGAVYETLRSYAVTDDPPNRGLILIAVGTATVAAIFNSQLLATSHLLRSEHIIQTDQQT
ncbi:MAG: hypothetical protein RLP44_16485 [Aggregatilineales bacterium]